MAHMNFVSLSLENVLNSVVNDFDILEYSYWFLFQICLCIGQREGYGIIQSRLYTCPMLELYLLLGYINPYEVFQSIHSYISGRISISVVFP